MFVNHYSVLFFALFITISSTLLAKDAARRGSFDSNKLVSLDPSQTTFSLVTMGPSHELYTSGGHSLLRLINKNEEMDLVFNWGTFDPETPLFAFKFYYGSLPYKLSINHTLPHLELEKRYNPRLILEDELNLTTEQKRTLLDELSWWIKPEHQEYQYHIWSDNCSSKVRDLLNKVHSGKIKEHFDKQKTGETYRRLWFETFGDWYGIAALIDVFLNSEADYKTSPWDEMYIPQKMHEFFLTFPSLITKTNTLNEGTFSIHQHKEGYLLFLFLFLLLDLICLCFWRKKIFWKIYSMRLFLWGIISSLLGVMVYVSSFLTLRSYFYLPATTLLFSPLDAIFIYCGWNFCEDKIQKIENVYRIACFLHLLGIIILVLAKSIGLIEQDISNLFLYILPTFLGIFFAMAKRIQSK